jgi:hypothetical protein
MTAYLWNRRRFLHPLLCRNFGLRYLKANIKACDHGRSRHNSKNIRIDCRCLATETNTNLASYPAGARLFPAHMCFRLAGQRNYHKGVSQSASSLFQVGNRAGGLILGLSSCDASARPAAMRSFNIEAYRGNTLAELKSVSQNIPRQRGSRTAGERAIHSSSDTNSPIRQTKPGARNEMLTLAKDRHE